MVNKYGKPIDMRELRSLDSLTKANRDSQKKCFKYSKKESAFDGKCRLCEGKHVKKYFVGYHDFTYYQCQECKGLFLSNLPKVNDMYGEDACNAQFYVDENTFQKRINSIVKPKVDFVMDVCLKEGISISSWLDIGSGGGHFLSYLESIGIRAKGIESDVSQYRFSLEKGLLVENTFIDPNENNLVLDEMVGTSDVVSLITVLEHIEKPNDLLNYLKKSMKKNAVLVIEVPRHPSLSSFVCMQYPDVVIRHMALPIHLQLFNEKTFDVMLGDEFEIVAKWCFGQGFSDLINFPIIQGKKVDDQELYNKIMEKANCIQEIIDEGDLADELFIVAVKK